MRARPIRTFGSASSLILITGLAAGVLLGCVLPVAAQSDTAETEVRNALENATFEMRLGGDHYLGFNLEAIEFLPASHVVPGGGFLITRDITDNLIFGASYEMPQWAVRTQEGAVVLSLTFLQEGEPLVTIEGPISPTDGGYLTIDLRGSAQGPDGLEEMVVAGSLVPLETNTSEPSAHQREALFGQWTLHRLEVSTLSDGERALDTLGEHPIAYTFASDGSFAVEVNGELETDTPSEVFPNALRGHWAVTRGEWEQPPIFGEADRGRLLILLGAAPAPDVFMILSQTEDALVMKSVAPTFLLEEMVWATLHLGR